jgi:hypothetical protein
VCNCQIWKMLWPEQVVKALRHMQKSCRPNVSQCGETTFDLRSNSLGRRGKLVPCDQFYSLLRVAVRRGLEFSGTHQHHSKLRRMEAKFWPGAFFWHECQISLRSLGIQHTVQTAPSSNCSSLSVLFERLRLSQGSEP